MILFEGYYHMGGSWDVRGEEDGGVRFSIWDEDKMGFRLSREDALRLAAALVHYVENTKGP